MHVFFKITDNALWKASPCRVSAPIYLYIRQEGSFQDYRLWRESPVSNRTIHLYIGLALLNVGLVVCYRLLQLRGQQEEQTAMRNLQK